MKPLFNFSVLAEFLHLLQYLIFSCLKLLPFHKVLHEFIDFPTLIMFFYFDLTWILLKKSINNLFYMIICELIFSFLLSWSSLFGEKLWIAWNHGLKLMIGLDWLHELWEGGTLVRLCILEVMLVFHK